MTTTAAQQVALDNALVPLEKRVKIGKCNMRIDPAKTKKEPTYQVVLDALALTTCYLVFLITADVPKIYMQQFWFTINKKDSTTYQFKIDKKSYRIDMEVFKEIFQICSRLSNQDFDELPMTNQQMLDSNAYKTYLAYGTNATSPKIKRKVKRHASPSKKRTLVTVEEEEPEPAKKVVPTKKTATKRQYSSVQIRDTPGVSVSKKKAPAKVARRKGIELLSDAALLEEAQLKKALKRSKRETNIHQAGGSSEGADFESDVPDKPKGKLIDTKSDDEPQHADDERTDYENQETNDDKEETEDEFVHTPQNYVPTGDEMNDESNDVTKEEYERINEELFGDVNVNLTDAEPTDLEKDDEEMTVTGHVNVNQEDAGNQVKDDAQATQKTEATTNSSLLTLLFPHLQQSTSIPTPTTTEPTTPTTPVFESETIAALQLRIIDLEKDVKELKDVDNSIKVISTIQSEVPKAIKEYLESSLDDAMHKKSIKDIQEINMEHARKQQVPKETIISSDTASLVEFDQKTTLLEKMTKSKSFNKSPKQRAQYHALMESILEDEDAMDEGVADKLKKRKPDYADKDEGPSTRSDRGLKRRKSKKTLNHLRRPKYTSNTDEPLVFNVDPKDWFKKSKRPPTLDPEWNKGKSAENKPTHKCLSDLAKAKRPSRIFDDLMSTSIDFNAFVMNRLQISELTQDILVGPNYNILKETCRSYVKLDYNMEECYKALADQLNWNNPEGNRYPFDLSKPLPLVMSVNRQIIQVDYFFNNDLAYLQGGSTGRTYMTSLTKTKAAKYDLPGIEDMVPNLWSPVKVAYDNHALLGTSHWGPKRQSFYEYASNRVSIHDVYSTKRIFVVTNVKVKEWYGYGHLEEIEVRRSDQQLYKFIEGDFPKLHLHDIEDMLILLVQNRLVNLKDKLERNRLMCPHDLYKFSDGTLISLRDTLKDMVSNLKMGYTSVMTKRRWSSLGKKRSRIMIKDIDRQLLDRRLMGSLKKFVGGREYEEDLRLLQWTI
uniref:Retrovirus-related Pol polyprotein from transposon TNT 1-94 n=1 Tax=Tanacetum cinerariifolium TaxID=118510 RepID=A0A699GRV8_TANCI|nr:hypothetical protein [Tanacetum cinerariifolium]